MAGIRYARSEGSAVRGSRRPDAGNRKLRVQFPVAHNSGGPYPRVHDDAAYSLRDVSRAGRTRPVVRGAVLRLRPDDGDFLPADMSARASRSRRTSSSRRRCRRRCTAAIGRACVCDPMSAAAPPRRTGWRRWWTRCSAQPDVRLRDEDLRRAWTRPRAGAAHVQAQLRHDVPGVSARVPPRHGDEGAARGGPDARRRPRTRDSSPTAAFARRSRACSAIRPAARAARPLLTATWIETPLGPMLAIAGDEGLELLEFVDRRALETELRELRRTLAARDRSRRPSDPAADAPRSWPNTSPARAGRSTCRCSSAAPTSSCARGARSARSRTARRGRTPTWRAGSGRPRAVRAIGRVNGQNRIAIVVPCHRVIRSDGSLCGYGGGRWRKQWLLDHEIAHR